MQSRTDRLMFAKMQFFHDIANILTEFLTKFQTDNQVMPFFSDLLENILRRLMKFFILAEVIKAAATAYKLMKLDIFDKTFSYQNSHQDLYFFRRYISIRKIKFLTRSLNFVE